MMTPKQKDFLKLMDEVSNLEGYRTFESFSAFLELAFHALVAPTLWDKSWQKNEDEYLAAIHRFKCPHDTADICAKALGVTIEALESGSGDFLGPIFMESAANSYAGQFFTPWCLCQAIAEMSIGDDTAAIAAKRPVTFQEPACGCGAMALAAADVLKRRGINPSTQAHFVMVDIDIRCVWAAYIQASLCGLSADVIHGNTLTLETWGSWHTVTAFMFPKCTSGTASASPVSVSPPKKHQTPAKEAMQLSFAGF